MQKAEFPSLRVLLRHSGAVLLLHELIEHEAEKTTALIDTSRQSWLKRSDGSIGAWVSFEYMAQCVAAHEGLRALAEKRNLPFGLLIGVHQLQLRVPEFAGDQRLWVSTSRTRGRPGLGALSHDCFISAEVESKQPIRLAEGRISVLVKPPPPRALPEQVAG